MIWGAVLCLWPCLYSCVCSVFCCCRCIPWFWCLYLWCLWCMARTVIHQFIAMVCGETPFQWRTVIHHCNSAAIHHCNGAVWWYTIAMVRLSVMWSGGVLCLWRLPAASNLGERCQPYCSAPEEETAAWSPDLISIRPFFAAGHCRMLGEG